MLNWMAWTWPTALFFIGLFVVMGIITYIEVKKPGTSERHGALGLTTTRGDRLFLSLLGSAYIFLAWLGFFGGPLWWPLAFSLCWATFCFKKV
jgi:predicted small integral membrane protein